MAAATELVAAPAPAAATEPATSFAGRSLTAALLDLRSRGLTIVFTSNVVRSDMTVAAEPIATEPRQILDEILAPHGLEARDGPGGTLVVVPRPAPETGLPADTERVEPEPGTMPVAVIEEELVVTPSRLSLLRREPEAPLALSRDDIEQLPHLGDDFFRALSLLPGVAANDVSAEFHVRGGRRDETAIVLDGQELYDTYHLTDFDSALSVIAPATLDAVDLSTGGFAVEHGDRMSGVLDMTTRMPTGAARTRLGLGIANAHVGTAGTFDEGRGGWLVEGRRGSIDLIGQLLGDEDPEYWDAFGKLDTALGERHRLRANFLAADDALDFAETTSDGSKRTDTHYRSSYLWLTHQATIGAKLLLETAVARGGVDRDRAGFDIEEDGAFDIRDQRELEVLEVRHHASFQLAPSHLLRWGLAHRDFDARYDYLGVFRFDNPLAQIREGGVEGSTQFHQRFEERHDEAYLADRLRLGGPVTMELGLRFDRHTQVDERLVSPRFNLAWAAGERSVVRAAWGRFLQSQRPYELQVEDGETEFQRVERSEHRVLGFEHVFGGAGEAGGPALRLELYQREIDHPLSRHENLYEPVNTFPEVEPDRVLVDPERSFAEGVEIFVRGGGAGRLGWWANYAWATSEDEIDGVRIARQFDQTHSLNLDLQLRLGANWSANFAWRYHTGWPTTPLRLEARVDEEGEVVYVPVLGPAYSARLPDYHRLDLRASRRWHWRDDRALVLFIDVQNVYDRRNSAGFDYEIDEDEGNLIPNEEQWAGFLPSAGVSFEF